MCFCLNIFFFQNNKDHFGKTIFIRMPYFKYGQKAGIEKNFLMNSISKINFAPCLQTSKQPTSQQLFSVKNISDVTYFTYHRTLVWKWFHIFCQERALVIYRCICLFVFYLSVYVHLSSVCLSEDFLFVCFRFVSIFENSNLNS